jgi:two-component system CheB/CheR fusion protein
MAEERDDDESRASSDAAFPIVAIGGSAGSLTAFQQILAPLPAGAGLAMVIVSHQDPERPSVLAEILAKSTALPVAQLTEGTRVQPGRVYVAPPGRFVGIRSGVFHIERTVERGHPPLPVDYFMRALASDQGHRAVGVVVSGTGSDGTLGLGAIRAEAGLTLAQQPEQAEFGGMPGSAIAAGVVDVVATPAQLAERLVAHARRPFVSPPEAAEPPHAHDDMERIVEMVGARTGHDFSAYKRGTLQRRIERRIHLHQLHTSPSISASSRSIPTSSTRCGATG